MTSANASSPNAGYGCAFTAHYAFALPNAFTLHHAFAPHNAFGPIITLCVMVRVCCVILHTKKWRFKNLKGYCLNAHPPFPPSHPTPLICPPGYLKAHQV